MSESIGFEKTFRMRRAVKGEKCIIIGIPYELVKREADKRKLSIDQFIENFVVVASYNDSGVVTYRFEGK
jgi:regulatory protein YycI of two-component signal transduction system YycFG